MEPIKSRLAKGGRLKEVKWGAVSEKEKKSAVIDKLLSRLYYDSKSASAYSGRENVYKAAKLELPSITRREVSDWFSGQLTYTLHKPVRYNFSTNKTIVLAIDDQWQADLVDLSSRAKDNDGYTFLLTVIDCFSKMAWVEPLYQKTATELLTVIKRILKKSGRKPKRLQTDKGKEFTNKLVQDFLREQNIHFFTTNGDKKSAIVERFNRTLKTRMFKYFTAKRTTRYIDILPELVEGYNNSYHRSIKMRPIDVKVDDEPVIRRRLYGGMRKRSVKKYKYWIGDLVRISKARRVFEKGYLPSWTEETFIIYDRRHTQRPIYFIRDFEGENIEGAFYEEELQKVIGQEIYRIEEVLKTKKVAGGKTLYLVKWEGWPSKFNSWVEDIRTLQRDDTI